MGSARSGAARLIRVCRVPVLEGLGVKGACVHGEFQFLSRTLGGHFSLLGCLEPAVFLDLMVSHRF